MSGRTSPPSTCPPTPDPESSAHHRPTHTLATINLANQLLQMMHGENIGLAIHGVTGSGEPEAGGKKIEMH